MGFFFSCWSRRNSMAGVTRIGESPPPGWCLSTMTSLENGRPTIVDDGLRKSDSRRRRNGGAVARTGRPPRRRASRLARNGVITTQRPMRAQTRRGRSLRASTFRDPWCRMQIKNNYEIRVRARTKCEAHGNRGGGEGGNVIDRYLHDLIGDRRRRDQGRK